MHWKSKCKQWFRAVDTVIEVACVSQLGTWQNMGNHNLANPPSRNWPSCWEKSCGKVKLLQQTLRWSNTVCRTWPRHEMPATRSFVFPYSYNPPVTIPCSEVETNIITRPATPYLAKATVTCNRCLCVTLVFNESEASTSSAKDLSGWLRSWPITNKEPTR